MLIFMYQCRDLLFGLNGQALDPQQVVLPLCVTWCSDHASSRPDLLLLVVLRTTLTSFCIFCKKRGTLVPTFKLPVVTIILLAKRALGDFPDSLG